MSEPDDVMDRRLALSRMMDDEDLMKQAAAAFLPDSAIQVQRLLQALETADMDSTARVAHTLRGVAGIFAASPCEHAAQRVEAASRAGDVAAARDAGVTLVSELKRLTAVLEKL